VITILLNPQAGSGGGEDIGKRLEELFRETRTAARICRLRPGENPVEAAREAARGATAVVAPRGAGTGCPRAGTDIPLGVLPLGTLNHFARDLGIPLDLKPAVETIAAGRGRGVDVGRLNDRLFLNNASIGLYPSIVELRDQMRQKGRRKLPAFISATASVLWSYRGVVAALESESGNWVGRTPFVFVGNNEYTVDGLKLGGRHSLTGGQIVAYVTPRVRTRRLPLLLAQAIVGRGQRSGSFATFAAARLDITLAGQRTVQVALDGELTSMTTPLHFRVEPLGLNVL
jgi:diacylglycerol kinase family enzyme